MGHVEVIFLLCYVFMSSLLGYCGYLWSLHFLKDVDKLEKKSGKEEMNKRVENSNLRKGLKNCVAYNREEKPQCRLIVVIRYVKYCHIL